MDDDKQVAALAAMDGWEKHAGTGDLWRKDGHYSVPTRRLPQYLHVISDAMRVMRASLRGKRVEFILELAKVCDRDFGGEVEPSDVLNEVEMAAMFLLDPSPRQYMEAMLKVLAVWEETEPPKS